MAKIDLTTLKSKFETGDTPTGDDFVNLIDTLDDSGVLATGDASLSASITSLTTVVAGKADTNHTHSYQAADADLLAIGGLSDVSTGFLKKTGANTWALDTIDLSSKADKVNGTLTNPTFTNYVETTYAPAAGSAFSVDLANGTIQKFTTNGNTTITLPASVAGKCYTVIVAYGGTHTVTFAGGTSLLWSGGSAPTATSVNGKFDLYTFLADGARTFGSDAGRNF